MNPDHLDRLETLLENENAFIREGSVKGLGSMLYHRVASERIIELLKAHKDTSPAIREAVEEALSFAE